MINRRFFSTGQAQLDLLVRKPIEHEQTVAWKRIVHKLDLGSIYPDRSPAMMFNVSVTRVSSSPNFKRPFNLLLENDKFYFLSTVDRPATLRLNIYLNSTVKAANGTQDIRKYTRVFDVREDKAKRTHVFELKSSSSLENILKSEKAILDSFDTKLWKSAKPCKDCLSIAYIHPDKKEYVIGIASPERHSDLLDEFCFLRQIPAEYVRIANLTLDRREARCVPLKTAPNQPVEEYVVNVFANVSLKIMTRSFGQGFVNFMNWLPNMTPWRPGDDYNPRDHI